MKTPDEMVGCWRVFLGQGFTAEIVEAIQTDARADLIDLLRGFQTEINPDQLRVWLSGSGQLERIVDLLKRTEKLLKEVDL